MTAEIKLLTLVNWENQTHDDLGTAIRPKEGESWRDCYQRLHDKIYSSSEGALQQAAFYNCDRAIQKLVVQRGLDVNGKHEKMTALAWAVNKGATESVRMLLTLHADAYQSSMHFFPLQYINGSNVEMAQLLLDHMSKENPKIWKVWEASAHRGDYRLLTLLVERKFDINIQNSKGETVLNELMNGWLDNDKRKMAAWLIAHGANVNIPDKERVTPLHHAMASRDIGCIEMLFDAGADKFAVDKNGDGCLAWGLFECSPAYICQQQNDRIILRAFMLGLKCAPYLIRLYTKCQNLKNLFHLNR